jgi:hypothetical protein
LPVNAKNAAPEIKMTPTVKKTFGGLRSDELGMNNALHFLFASMRGYTALPFWAVVGGKSP